MCYKVSTEVLLFNYFAKSDAEVFTFSEMEQIINKIKKKSNDSVIVDTDKQSIENAASMYSHLFRLKSTYIELVSDCGGIKNEIQSLEKAHNRVLPENVKKTCSTIFSDYEQHKRESVS